MKLFKLLMLLFAMMLTPVAFTACDGEDDVGDAIEDAGDEIEDIGD